MPLAGSYKNRKTGTRDSSETLLGPYQQLVNRDPETLVGPCKSRKIGIWDECGVSVNCKCMEFVVTGCCTRNWLRFNQTIRYLTSGDLGIPLKVSRLGVTDLKKTRVVSLLHLFEGRGENGQCHLVHAESLQKVGLMVVMLISYSRLLNMILVLWGVDPILRKEYGI